VGTVFVSAAILYYFLGKEDWSELWKAAAQADTVMAALGVFVPLLVFWITDAAFSVKSIEWFHRRVPLTDFIVVKAAFYLLTLVNISLGTGGVFLYFLRKAQISVRKQAGILAWRISVAVSGYLAVFFLLTLAMLVFYPEQAGRIRMDIWLPVLGVILALAADWTARWMLGKSLVFRLLKPDPTSEFWAAFTLSRPRHWFIGWAYTVPAIVSNFLGMYVVARAFGIDVPFFYFAFWIPVVVMFAALPVAFGGFGTTTAAWAGFFGGYASTAAIGAATIFIPGARLLLRIVLGLVFLPACMRELEAVAVGEEVAVEKAEAEGPL